MNGLSIYKSSAGSGKTFTLVKEYLQLVLAKPVNYRHILGITFTNKAADEMKTRIVRSLVELAEGKNAGLEKLLLSEMSEGEERKIPDGFISRQAKSALTFILHDYSGFAISTIDSFFYRIIRSVSRELQLPLAMDIETDMGRVIREITDQLFNDLGNNTGLSAWMEELALTKINNGKGWKIEDDIRNIAFEIFREQFNDASQLAGPEEIKKFSSDLYAIKKSYEKQLQLFGEKGIGIISSYHLEIIDFAYGKSGVASAFSKAQESPGEFVPGLRMLAASENPDLWYTKKSLKKNEVATATEELLPVLHDILGWYSEKYMEFNSANEILKNIHLFGITEDLLKNIKRYREEQHVLLISDITLMLNNLISENDAPFIYEKTGSTFHHFLIDEFQDTSDTQWKNLHPLVSHALSEGNFAMIVGDAKQAIYRWRNGNTDLLLNGVKKSLASFREIISEKYLGTNYRSKAEIVKFNNHFFSSAKKLLISHLQEESVENVSLLENAYSENDIEQGFTEKNAEGGFLEFRFIVEEAGEADTEKTWKEKSLDRLLETLHELRNENFSFSDIAILVRKNSEGAAITHFLFENGITEIVSPDSLMLYASPKIQFLLSIFSCFDNSEDIIAQTHVLYFYNFYLSSLAKADIHSVFTNYSVNRNNAGDTSLPEEFSAHIPFLRKLPLYELTEQLIRIFHLNSPPDAFIQRFQDVVFDFSRRDSSGISDFLEYWDENKETEKCALLLPENKNAITVMTVHKSKGLQFPVVLIPFLDWEMGPSAKQKQLLWVSSDKDPYKKYSPLPVSFSKQLGQSFFSADYYKEITLSYLDNLNLLYVAFTRPEERLYVFAPAGEYQKPNTSSALASLFFNTEYPGAEKTDDADVVIQQGIKQAKKLSAGNDKDRSLSEILPVSLSNPWNTKIAIASKGKKRMDAFTLEDSPGISGMDYGLLVHDLLKEIRIAGDIPKSLSDLHYEGVIGVEEKEILKTILDKLVNDTDTAFLFSPGWEIINEKEILLPDGSVHRPDRVLTNGSKAIVVDYKTSVPHEKHEEQVKLYARILLSMGFSEVQPFLLYIQKNPVHITLQEIN